jgi:hypothetical protein
MDLGRVGVHRRGRARADVVAVVTAAMKHAISLAVYRRQVARLGSVAAVVKLRDKVRARTGRPQKRAA